MTTRQARPAGWKNYDDFSQGIDTNRLPRSEALTGSTLEITLDDGSELELAFQDASTVSWSEAAGPRAGDSGSDWYEAVEVTPDVLFLDLTFAARPVEALTLIVNRSTRRVLSVLCFIVDEDAAPGEPRVQQRFRTGVLGDPAVSPEGEEPAPTRDLIGRRTLQRYSPDHLYEHTYLSSERYCWQCLEGVQRGHGDCDLATAYRFAENQYLFTFREFRIPVASVFFFDMEGLRSTGKFLGLTGDGRVSNSPAGSHIIPLSQTVYPDGVAPV